MNIIIKRFLAFFLSFTIIFATTVRANANTSVGGWSAVDIITAGATNTINATKTAGGKALKSAITIAPQAGKVGKYLLRGGAAGALALAVPQLLGEGVDWVLDPANNAVKYKAETADKQYDAPVNTVWSIGQFQHINALTACTMYHSFMVSQYPDLANYKGSHSPYLNPKKAGSYPCMYKTADNRSLGLGNLQLKTGTNDGSGSSSDDWKSIPINTVATQVISNAESGNAPSQEAVKAAALEGFAAGEHDAALDAAATEVGSDAGTENPPDTENPPKDPDAPAEPFDPAGIISAINALKALLAGILSSIASLSDFFQSEPPPDPVDTELDIPDNTVLPVDTDINFGGACPANFEVNSSIFGNPINITLLDTSKFCGFLSTFVKYPVYAVSSLYALYILGGRKDV